MQVFLWVISLFGGFLGFLSVGAVALLARLLLFRVHGDWVPLKVSLIEVEPQPARFASGCTGGIMQGDVPEVGIKNSIKLLQAHVLAHFKTYVEAPSHTARLHMGASRRHSCNMQVSSPIHNLNVAMLSDS